MVRRFFVPVFVAALILGVAPSPSFGLGAGEVRPRHRFDDHYRCMYRCDERGDSFRPPPRPHRPGWGSWPPRPRPRPPARPSWHRPGCWLFCGPGGWGGGWSGPYGWCGPGPFSDDGWYRNSGWHGRHCRPDGHGWYDHDRYDRSDRHRGHDDDRGYDAHRSHPRGRDF